MRGKSVGAQQKCFEDHLGKPFTMLQPLNAAENCPDCQVASFVWQRISMQLTEEQPRKVHNPGICKLHGVTEVRCIQRAMTICLKHHKNMSEQLFHIPHANIQFWIGVQQKALQHRRWVGRKLSGQKFRTSDTHKFAFSDLLQVHLAFFSLSLPCKCGPLLAPCSTVRRSVLACEAGC